MPTALKSDFVLNEAPGLDWGNGVALGLNRYTYRTYNIVASAGHTPSRPTPTAGHAVTRTAPAAGHSVTRSPATAGHATSYAERTGAFSDAFSTAFDRSYTPAASSAHTPSRLS